MHGHDGMTSLRRYMRTLYGLMAMVCIRSCDNYVTTTSCSVCSVPGVERVARHTSGITCYEGVGTTISHVM